MFSTIRRTRLPEIVKLSRYLRNLNERPLPGEQDAVSILLKLANVR